MADVSGKFFSAKKVRTGVSPSSPGVEQGETLPPVNPPGTSLNSVGLTMPSAFAVANSPLTSNGTIAVTGAGTVAQYVRGDGSLADFPESSGGGSSVSYYLNGSVSQGTIGGVAYLEMNKVPILGAGTDFTRNSNGYIASFITDAGDPNLLEIPGGNWNFESYFSASSGGGSPTFYVELYKVNSGGTATLIASNSANPELISFGTTIAPYFSSLAVPTTVLALTDRLAVRYYVTPGGRTLTLHTEGPHLCQIITTFTTGLTALNGLTAQVQNFAVGTSGTDFNIASATATHTFNLPTASATNRGALSSADWTVFNSKIGGSGTSGQIAYFNGTSSITGESSLFWDATNDILQVTGSIFPATDNTGVIGNSSFTWSNGQFTNLTIDGTLNVRAAIDLADNDILRFGSSDDWEFFHDGTNNLMDLNVGNLVIRDNVTTRLTIERTTGNIVSTGGASFLGNVGVGTATINHRFQVAPLATFGNAEDGNICISTIPSGGTSTSPTTTGGIIFGDNTVANSYLGRIAVIQDNPSASTASHMRFYTNSSGGNGATTERLRITAAGRVLIGTPPPAESTFALDVNGTGRFSGSLTTGADLTLSAANPFIYGGTAAGSLGLSNIGGQSYIRVFGASHATTPNVTQFVNAGSTSLTIASTGAATFSGSVSTPHSTKTANYTLTETDYTVGFDCASNRTATLPDATTCAGRIYVIYQYNTNLGARSVTLDGNGSQTINGLTTYNLLGYCDYSSVIIQSNGSNWIIIANALETCPV